MKTVILCGGQGTRIQEATGGIKPKPMVEIGGRPVLWHIMKGYAHYGHTDFVLCLGHLGNVIKDYFLHYEAMNSDISLSLGASQEMTYHRRHDEGEWRVTLADTGQEVMTGARLARVRRYVGEQTFMLTYGDGVSDIDIDALLAFHRAHGKIATLTGVSPAGRFGHLHVEDDAITSFVEKPRGTSSRINGGFFVFEPRVFDFLSVDASCVLEREPMEKLAGAGELMMYGHDGFWQCMDTHRDWLALEQLWRTPTPPWRVWSGDPV